MTWLSRLTRVCSRRRNVRRQAQGQPEEWLEEMTARLELELIELRRVLAEALASLNSAERQRLRYPAQAGVLDNALRERRELIERIRQSLGRLETQCAQVRARKNSYLARLETALAEERLERIAGHWQDAQASQIFADLEAEFPPDA